MERTERAGRREPLPKKTLHCCCGRPECLILKKNFSVLESVEKDVHTAAQLGQALLSRHEAYMAEAERDRMRLNTRIDRLEMDKEELETQNSLKVQDNLALIDQLECLNNTVSDADAKIKDLEATLLSSQQALRHFEGTATRAVNAERNLKDLVEEQERLQGELQSSREEARSQAYRFKEAQRGILDMQDQLDRMEKEARQERERHHETLEKMERQREVERQLGAAALRLKGAAASKSTKPKGKISSRTVGNFVRDLLQDNANLQTAIADLREMLFNSNDEIQSLREELLFHQPVLQTGKVSLLSILKPELSFQDAPKSQELQLHDQGPALKQDRRRSNTSQTGLLGSYPSPSCLRPSSTPAALSTLNQWRSISSPAGSIARSCENTSSGPLMPLSSGLCTEYYSFPSSAVSSVVGSPQSSSQGYFDRAAHDVDRPISPSTSYDPISPAWRASHRKRASEASCSSSQSLSLIDSESARAHGHYSHRRWASTTIREEDEDEQTCATLRSGYRTTLRSRMVLADELELSQDEDEEEELTPRTHDVSTPDYSTSLAGGLDMSSLLGSPGHITLRSLGSVDAVVSGVNAEPTLARTGSRMSDAALRNHFAHFKVSKLSSTLSAEAITSRTPRGGAGGLGAWTGWRPWGSNFNQAVRSVPQDANSVTRATGINQSGSLPGLSKYWKTAKPKAVLALGGHETNEQDGLSRSCCDDANVGVKVISCPL